MPAFSGARSYQIGRAIQLLFERCLHHFNAATDFTHDELLRAFVKPEHQRMVVEIQQIADISASNHTFEFLAPEPTTGEVYSVRLVMQGIEGHTPFVVPRYATQPLPDADPEVMTKIGTWLTRRRKLSEDFGHLCVLINWCNAHCTTPAQVRYLWPGVLTLIGMADAEDEGAKNLVDSLRRFRVPSTMPRLPAGIKEYAAQAEARVARALLLPRIEDTPVHLKQVTIHIAGAINAGPPSWDKTGRGIAL